MQTKSELRIVAKNIRDNIDMINISEKILKNFLASEYYKYSHNIAAYYPIGSEVRLTKIFDDDKKNFYLPKILNKKQDMYFVSYNHQDMTTKNIYNIPEPNGVEVSSDIFDVIILPALMADKKGYRLGYGKGFYDRYLNNNITGAKKIILIPKELLVETIPSDEFDVAADIIITQNDIVII